MSVEAALRSVLVNDAAVAALVSERVWPQKAKQSTPKRNVQYGKTAGGRSYCLSGETPDREGTWQFDCRAETQEQANELADAVADALSAVGRTAVSVGADVTYFQGCFVIDDYEAIEPPDFGTDNALYWSPVGVQVWIEIA